jgi:uncharacterized protein
MKSPNKVTCFVSKTAEKSMLEKSEHASRSHYKTESKCINIRAHHLCCIQGFQGYGYSPAFVTNMRTVISDIKASPSRPIKLVSECDTICASCPSKRECSTQKSVHSHRIKNMDLVVMEKLNIEEGTVMEANEAFRLINLKLNTSSEIEDVCEICKWKLKCLWYTQTGR